MRWFWLGHLTIQQSWIMFGCFFFSVSVSCWVLTVWRWNYQLTNQSCHLNLKQNMIVVKQRWANLALVSLAIRLSTRGCVCNITGKRINQTVFLFVHKINGHSRLFWTSWFWCRFAEPMGYIHSLSQLLLMALIIHVHSACIQNITSGIYFLVGRFMHNSSCWASMRLMLLLTCCNSYCRKQQTFFHYRSHIQYSPWNANTTSYPPCLPWDEWHEWH